MTTSAKRRNVLIVDDHEPTRLLIGRIVTQELGARVSLAGTCEEALRQAEQDDGRRKARCPSPFERWRIEATGKVRLRIGCP